MNPKAIRRAPVFHRSVLLFSSVSVDVLQTSSESLVNCTLELEAERKEESDPTTQFQRDNGFL
jgi:hypothetical protein